MGSFNRLFFFVCSAFLLLQSCDVKPTSKEYTDSVLTANKDSVSLDSVYWETQGQLVPDEDLFYAVYELSSKTQAIVFEVTYDPAYTKMDSLMQDIVHSNIYYDEAQNPEMSPLVKFDDTLGRFDLLQSKQVTEKLSAFLEGDFFIYCTKGIVKRKMKDVLFSANSSIARHAEQIEIVPML